MRAASAVESRSPAEITLTPTLSRRTGRGSQTPNSQLPTPNSQLPTPNFFSHVPLPPVHSRPVATSLLMVAILLVGIVAFRELSVSALPQVDYPIIQVQTFYPGAGPDVMASSVTAPLERQFGQVPGLSQMTSTSSQGSSLITLEFSLDLNIDVAEQEVQAAINAAATYLPADLPNPPIYAKTNPADTPILTLALTSDPHAADAGGGPGRHAAGPEDLQLSGRGAGQHQRRAAAGGAHPVNPVPPPVGRGHQPGGRPHRRRGPERQRRQGHDFDGPSPVVHDRRQRPAAVERRLPPLVVAYRNGAPVRAERRGHRDRRRRERPRAWRRG